VPTQSEHILAFVDSFVQRGHRERLRLKPEELLADLTAGLRGKLDHRFIVDIAEIARRSGVPTARSHALRNAILGLTSSPEAWVFGGESPGPMPTAEALDLAIHGDECLLVSVEPGALALYRMDWYSSGYSCLMVSDLRRKAMVEQTLARIGEPK
jgi:hypothetical protein